MDIDLQACIDGDPQAWSAFVHRTMPVIAAAVRRVIRPGPAGAQELAEDVVQDVFVRLVADDYRLLKTYDAERAKLTTWLTVVARSTAIDAVRKRRLETVSLDAEAGARSMPTRDDGSPTGPDGGGSIASPDIPLHFLTDRQRLVLTLLFEDGLSVPEAATVLDVDDQTIRSTKHKALTRLRAHLEQADGPQSSSSPEKRGQSTGRSETRDS